MFRPAYLSLSRHNIYYFRYPLPAALSEGNGRSFLKLSLHTRNPKEALQVGKQLEYHLNRILSDKRFYEMPYTKARQLLTTFFSQKLDERKRQIAQSGRLQDLDVIAYENSRDFAIQAIEDKDSDLDPFTPIGDTLKQFMAINSLNDLNDRSPEYKHLKTEFKYAYRSFCEDVLSYNSSLDDYVLEAANKPLERVSTKAHPIGEVLEYAEKLRKQGKDRLMHELRYSAKGGYAKEPSRWFNERFLTKLNLKSDKVRKDFHSLRHTVITKLFHADVSEPEVQAIVGHAKKTVTQVHYFKDGHTLKQLATAIVKVDYPM